MIKHDLSVWKMWETVRLIVPAPFYDVEEKKAHACPVSMICTTY